MAKKIILIISIILIIIGGIILLNKVILKDEPDVNNQNTNTNVSTYNEENKKAEFLEVSSLNEVKCELSSSTVKENDNVKKDYFKTDDGKIEINISSFDTKIQNTEVYNEETVKDGAILFYYGSGKNYIEKFNMEGKSVWKTETVADYKFYDIIESEDYYIMLGNADTKYIIAKMNLDGKITSAEIVEEKITEVVFVESKEKGYFKIAGISTEGRVVIVKYSNEIVEEEAIKTKLKNVECSKIVEINNNYYGIAADNTIAYQKQNTILFKLDNKGNEIFKFDILENSEFKDYVKSSSWIEDISVNHHYIFIVVANQEDVLALNLDGTLKKVFGYSTNTKLNKGYHSDIDHVKAVDEGVLVYGKTAGQNIDMISNEFNFKYRINISDTKLLPKTSTIKQIQSSRLQESKYLDAELFDETLMVIYQYDF